MPSLILIGGTMYAGEVVGSGSVTVSVLVVPLGTFQTTMQEEAILPDGVTNL